MSTPLYDALRAYASSRPLRLHMPGHKGHLPGVFRSFAEIDVTELPPVGNLYTGQGPVRQAEALYARTAGASDALFFSCGSTQGIQTMLLAAVGAGGTVILDRGCHQSVYHAMALLDIQPVYLFPRWRAGLPEPVTPELAAPVLAAHPEAAALLVTTPDYYGQRTPLTPLKALCHSRGVALLVDQAHGAHFPFIGLPSAVQEGADLAVTSAHKTLPALGSASVLLTGETAAWRAAELKAMSAVFSTTSPSWPILASIDLAREQLQGAIGMQYRKMAELVPIYRDRIRTETHFSPLEDSAERLLDPCRLTLDTGDGIRLDRLLQEQGIYFELADPRFLVAILTGNDTEETLNTLLAALKGLAPESSSVSDSDAPPAPVPRISLRSGLLGSRIRVPLADAAGRIAAQVIAPYPPGIPVVAPGEEITEKHIAYLQKKRYNIEEETAIRDL